MRRLLLGLLGLAYAVADSSIALPAPNAASSPPPCCIRHRAGWSEGVWAAESQHWETIGTSCAATPWTSLIGNRSSSTPGGCETPRILFLSDSVDVNTLFSVCRHVGGKAPTNKGAQRPDAAAISADNLKWNSLQVCSLQDKLVAAHRYVPGVHMDGPYNNDLMPPGPASNCLAQTGYAAAGFLEATGGKAPHMVVLAANYWDIARLRQFDVKSETERSGLPRYILDGYSSNLTAWVRRVQKTFPDSLIVYHTHTVPKHDGLGKLFSWGSYVVSVQQLNAVGRSVARSLGIITLDMALMGASFTSSTLNKDSHHPHAWFSLEVFDQYLNILHDCDPARFACWARAWRSKDAAAAAANAAPTTSSSASSSDLSTSSTSTSSSSDSSSSSSDGGADAHLPRRFGMR